MSEIYDATYSAISRRLGNCDLGAALDSYLRGVNLGYHAEIAFASIAESAKLIADDHMRPSVTFRPAISIDGDQWCALYGENLHSGVAGFGDTPDAAARDFDKAWRNKAHDVLRNSGFVLCDIPERKEVT